MSNPILDVLISNIKEDQMLLTVVQAKIEESKNQKQEIVNRLKNYRNDASVFIKYADEDKKKELEAIGFSFSETDRGLNSIASIAFDLVVKAKNHQLTNIQLYDQYVKSLKNKRDAVNYTAFNIKCRSLFNTQKLLRKKGKDTKSSKEDIISLNGRVLPKEEKK